MTDELKKAALLYASIGWRVFPLKPGAKIPATRDGFKAATVDTAKIEAWWSENPNFNIGCATGDNGLFVIDVDRHGAIDGNAAFNAWQSVFGGFPTTAYTATPRGGNHYFYRADGAAVRTRAGVFDGVDVRGVGGYIVLPPSIVNGTAYRWLNHPLICGVALADSNVLDFVRHKVSDKQDTDGAAANRVADAPTALPAILFTRKAPTRLSA